MADSNDLLETQNELKKYLKSNNLMRQAHMYSEFSFLLPNVTQSLQKTTPPMPTRLWGELQFQIAKITQQPEWPELVATVQPIININIETLVTNVNSQIENSNKSNSKSCLSISDRINLVSLFIALYPYIVNDNTRAIAASVLNTLYTIFAQFRQS